MKNFYKTLVSIFIFGSLYSCASNPRFICDFNDRCPELSQKITTTKASMQSYLSGKNSLYLSINFDNSNVNVYTTQNPSINVILKDNGVIIDTLSTSLNFNNSKITLSNPNIVNNFISANLGFFNEVSYDISGIKYSSQAGNNNVSFDIEYNNFALTGASWSYYEPPPACIVGTCQLQ